MRFEKIRWKNLFSYGKKWTEFRLDTNESINIIGNNGNGKSVLIEAIYLALTGKPFRKCNKNQIVNIHNKTDCLVELTAYAGKHKYLIRRGAKPNVFLIFKDDSKEPLDESAMMVDTQTFLETVLGFTTKNLKHTLIMSTTDYLPFLRLPAADKRLFIEDILSIEIFTVMNKLIKAKLSILKDEIRDNETEIDKLQYKLNMILEYNKQQQQNNDAEIAELKKNIKTEETFLAEEVELIEHRAGEEKKKEDVNLAEDISRVDEKSAASIKAEKEKLKEELAGLKTQAAELKSLMADLKAQNAILAGQLDDTSASIEDLNMQHAIQTNVITMNTLKKDGDISKYEANKKKGEDAQLKIQLEIKSAEKDFEYYTGTEECTECGQKIDPDFKKKQLDDIKADIKKLQLKSAKIKSELDKVENLKRRVDKFVADEITPLEEKCRELDQEIGKMKSTRQQIETDMKVAEQKEIACRKQMEIFKATRDKIKADAAARIAALEDTESIIADLNKKHEMRADRILSDALSRVTKVRADIQRRIDGYKKKIAELESEERRELKDEDGPRRELNAAEQAKKDLAFKKKVHDIAIQILSDKGIKTYIIKRYIPKLNKLINQYLEILSASYKLSFNAELEEQIALQGYDKLSYNNFSEGERQRCDVALLFAFLDIGKLKNSVTSNLLLMDEVVDRSLDDEGLRGIINIIESMKGKGYTIVNISHKHQLADKFDKTFRAVKDTFSRLEEL